MLIDFLREYISVVLIFVFTNAASGKECQSKHCRTAVESSKNITS